MNDSFGYDDVPSAEAKLSEVERLLWDAGGLIEVSDDLRPRTLEQARAIQHDRRLRQHLVLAIVAWIPLSIAFYPPRLSARSSGGEVSLSTVVRSSDVFLLADARVANRRSDRDWALVDVFQELMEQRAERMHNTSK
jgi:hypothetical protein